ncbi:eIF2A-related protein [Nodularia spumigena]|uniref:nSTAND1 domain-containing NTPase n=1 Tax=Nodularia spumigena TaxID=70799 RepID=UPI00232E4CAB|nr:CHAT domain-containing protein [Nodularia spumigena]MDB9350323.1 CHAT domain-containing protein [Nodularia spumigena CS-588/01]MDB9351133.1 CHAT domain-containing protein [Nodularia spumigena CS-588/05]
MEIWVNLRFGDGNFQQGFAQNQLDITVANPEAHITQIEFPLPPDHEITGFYQRWKQQYYSLLKNYRGGFKNIQVTHISKTDCGNYAESLRHRLHQWLRPIQSQLKTVFPPENHLEIRLVIHTDKISCLETKDILHRLPWQEWNLFSGKYSCEAAINFNSFSVINTIPEQSLTVGKIRRARIISIFGDSTNIDTNTDQELLKQLQKQAAELIVLTEPNRSDFNALWEEAYDILFFVGHSDTQSDGQTGIININLQDSLSLEEIKKTLRSAIKKGLKLAIFNSCNGLGLARQLADLNLPYIIVWREVVPDKSAQRFLKYFLSSFSQGESLFNSVTQARDRLKELANDKDIEKQLPGVSWLPIICQNTMVPPPSWVDLGGLAGELPESPYQGLSAFRQENAEFFFGREKFVTKLVAAVKNSPLVPIIGASGTGKSSVVYAGLLPTLEASGNVEIVSFRPGKNPFDALAIAFKKYYHSPEQTSTAIRLRELEFEIKSRENEQVLCQFINNIIISTKSQHFVLVADQFEELYTLTNEAESHQFLNALLFAINHAPNFTLVLTLRADFLGIALDYQPMGKALEQYPPLLLTPMDKEELRDVIEQPAFKMKVELEEGLTTKLIDDVDNHPGSLPLLEFALSQLWNKQKNWYLTHQAYQEIGGLETALAQQADQVFQSLSPKDKRHAESIFIQLVRPGEGTADTRRVATRIEVGEANWSLVKHLADERLLVTGWNEITEIETVEIVHEALIREWITFGEWIEINREFRIWQEILKPEVREWEKSHGNPDTLLQGTRLAIAIDWYKQRGEQLTKSEQDFITASITSNEQKQRQKKRIQKLIILGLSGALIVTFSFAVIAWLQSQNARFNEIKAISSSSKALLASGKNFEALIESLKASIKLNHPINNFTIHRIKEKNRIQNQVNVFLQEALHKVSERNRLETHKDEVTDITFSPDGTIIATASKDNTVKLWRLNGQEIATLKEHTDLVSSVRFSPNGKIIATASYDETVKLWTEEGKLITTITGHNTKVSSLTFSPNSNIIATADNKGYIKIWTQEGKLIRTFPGHKKAILNITFSPDSNTIATASQDKTVKLWTLEGKELQTLAGDNGHKDWVWSVNFSPDGQQIATASRDEKVKIWDLEGNLLNTLNGHKNSVTSVIFSPDGQLATASADKTVKIWSASGKEIQTLKGHEDWIWSVSFSPNGNILATASKDGTAKIWQIKSKQYEINQAHKDAIYSLNFSPDGNTYATASKDKTVKLWQRTGELIKTLQWETREFTNVSFSPNKPIIAAATSDGNVILWNLQGEKIRTFSGHNGKWIWQVSFSPDGNIIASAGHDGTVEIRKLNGELIHSIPAHKKGQDEDGEGVNSVVFSPDGQIIASAGWDKTVKLWTREGKLIKILDEHKDGVHTVSFSPDGKMFATASQDKTVKLWTREGKFIRSIDRHKSGVFRVRFSPDGKTIATASLDKTVKLWNLQGEELKTYQGHDDSVWSLDFSSDGNTLASADNAGKLILWDLNLDANQLIVDACNWVGDYLQNNSKVNESDRNLCKKFLN